MKRTDQPDDAMLPDDVAEAMLQAISPAMPAPQRADALRARILAQAKSEAAAPLFSQTVRAEDEQWVDVAPLVKMKMLHDDGKYRSFLMRLQAGARLPPHDHPGDEECLVLEGEGYIGDIFLRAGDYHFARKGMLHGETYTQTGALVFMRREIADEATA